MRGLFVQTVEDVNTLLFHLVSTTYYSQPSLLAPKLKPPSATLTPVNVIKIQYPVLYTSRCRCLGPWTDGRGYKSVPSPYMRDDIEESSALLDGRETRD
jgi:hypothetical protein